MPRNAAEGAPHTCQGARPLEQTASVLESRVLRREDCIQPRGCREAAGILEKGRVEERRPFGAGQRKLSGQPQSDQARTPRVAQRLAFDEVECVGEGREDLG